MTLRSVPRVVAIATGITVGAALWGKVYTHKPKPAISLPAEGAQSKDALRQAPQPSANDWHQVGLASWYGARFQGRETANGEPYNMSKLTCAHRFLPLGTWLKVTNLHSGKWIVVRVTDRGPAPETRIVDLSSEAARMLGMRGRGVTRVRLDVIDPHQAVEVARLDRLRLARLAAEADAAQADAGD